MQQKISVIVPVYNGEKYIASFIKCIAEQKYDNTEIIFVDDGSSDDTFKICENYAQNDKRIRVFQKENGGPSSARNYGIEKATGEYVVFFDIDDEFADSILSDNIKIALENDADIVMWNFRMICLEDGKEYIRKIGESFNGSNEEFFKKYLVPVLDNEMFNPPWNKLIKRSALINSNVRFDEKYAIYEDILFSYKLMQKTEKISINDNVYYDYIIKEKGSLLKKFHPECFSVILDIYKEAVEYGERYSDNSMQIERFKKQMIYLTKGYIKQICTNQELTYTTKKQYLSEIAENTVYISTSREVNSGAKSFPAKSMMSLRLYGLLIYFYKVLNFFR